MNIINSFKYSKKQDQWVDVNIQVKNDTNLIIQRDWQKRSSQELSDKKYWILNAPTGSGKSLEISCLTIEKLKRNPKLRVVIAVPQLIISNGFKDLKNIQLGDEIINWGLRHDFCNGLGKDNSGDLLNFLKRESYDNSYKDRIAIVTHRSLILAFDKKKKLFEDLLIIVDEAHHSEFGDVENTLQIFSDSDTEDEKFAHSLDYTILFSLEILIAMLCINCGS